MLRSTAPSVRIAAGIALGLTAATGVAAPNGYTLFWADEFNAGVGKQALPAWWNYNIGGGGWGNDELEVYTNSSANSHIVADPNATDGLALQIQALANGGNYTSARLLTQGKFNFQYGFIEARLRMPYGQGIWPAFWMLGSNISTVGWPACGEADIMENIGSVPTTNWGSLHAPSFNPSVTYVLGANQDYHSAYHLFQSNWSPNNFTFYVDDSPYHFENVNNDTSWPFNAPMFFIMNIAVGGNWPGSPNATTVFPQSLLADYVRIYRLTGPTSNEVVSFFATANSKFISAENAGTSPLDCSRTSASTWEQFLVVDLGANQVALLSQANGKYVTVATDGTNDLIANGSQVTTAGTFRWYPNADGTVFLKSMANGKYVTIDTGQNPPAVVANAGNATLIQGLGITCYNQMAAPSTPGVPQNLAVKATAKGANLTWSPVSGAVSYEVYETTNPGGSGMAPVATVSSAKYSATAGLLRTKYWFAVTALNSQGMSMRSSSASIEPFP